MAVYDILMMAKKGVKPFFTVNMRAKIRPKHNEHTAACNGK